MTSWPALYSLVALWRVCRGPAWEFDQNSANIRFKYSCRMFQNILDFDSYSANIRLQYPCYCISPHLAAFLCHTTSKFNLKKSKIKSEQINGAIKNMYIYYQIKSKVYESWKLKFENKGKHFKIQPNKWKYVHFKGK